jgi:hypothetical protein
MSHAMRASKSEAAPAAKATASAKHSPVDLRVGKPDDAFEQEAERAADAVMVGNRNGAAWSLSRMTMAPSLQRQCSCGGGECEECNKNRILQRDATAAFSQAVAPAVVHDVLRGPGRRLDRSTRSFMESRFGYDFGKVRIYEDQLAAKSAQAVAANAYTVGEKIVFNHGKYAPDSFGGRRLLAHELTHVVQQARGGSQPSRTPALEGEAGRLSGRIDDATTALQVHEGSGVGIAREAAPQETLIEVKFPDGVKRLTQEEFAEYKRRATVNLRRDLSRIAGLADNGRQSQESMLSEYHGGVESLSDVISKPKSLFGIAADMKAGVSPPFIGIWDHPKHRVELGLAALDRGDLAEGANDLSSADAQYRDAMQTWNAYREATIGGAEGVASNLETVRDVSFAIALVAGAAVALPAIAAVAGTGAVGTAVTAGGTAAVTGLGGAALGGGSTALASYAVTGKVDRKAVLEDAKKFGKQGIVTGLTAGLGSAAAASGKLAQPFVQAALKRCITEAGVNVAGEVTTELLDKVAPPAKSNEEAEQGRKPLIPGPARAALIGCVSGVLGVPVAKLGAGGRKVADLAIGAGVGYADARLSGQNNKEALLAAGQGVLTSAAIAHGHAGSERAKTQKKAPQQHEPASHVTKQAESPTPGHGGDATKSPTEKIVKKAKAATKSDAAPAILKEDAIAKKPIGDNHEAVVTEHGVARCSPSPCPVIHVEFAKELAEYPNLKKRNDAIQAIRKVNPERAAAQAAVLIRDLEEIRGTASKGGAKPPAAKGESHGGADRSMTREQWKKESGAARWKAAVDRAFEGNLEERASTPKVTGGPKSGHRIDGKKVPNKPPSRLDIGADPKGRDAAIPRREGETSHAAATRINKVIGKQISDIPALSKLWNDARASVLSRRQLTAENYGDLYNATRDSFWDRVKGNSAEAEAARNILNEAGIGFDPDKGRAPRLLDVDPKLKRAESVVSLDHNEEKARGDNWKKALDGNNLTLAFAMPNTNRENIQARHPELREEDK